MQGHLKQIAQVHVQLSSEYIHRLKFHNLSPQPFPVFDHSHSKKVEFHIFKFVSIIYCPVSGLHWLPHFLSFPPIKYLSTLSLLFSRLNWFRLTELIRLSSYSWCSSPFIASVVLCWTFASKSICPAVGSPELDSALKTWPHQCCVEGKDHLPQPVDNYLCNAAQDTDGLFLLQGCIAGLWSAYFLPQCTLQSCKRESSPLLVPGVILPHMHDLAFPRLISCNSCQPISPASLGSSEWQQDPLVLAVPPSFVSKPADSKVCPSIHIINEDVNQYWPSIDPCGIPLMTGLQLGFVTLITIL